MAVPRWLVWATLFGAGVAYEAHEIRAQTGGTLSETVRLAVPVETTLGRLVFLAGWGGFSAWFANHIIGGRSDPEWLAYSQARLLDAIEKLEE